MQKKGRWPRIRKFLNDVHLWLGLGSGVIVIAICFSGTVYVWNTELTEWSAPHLYRIKNKTSLVKLPIDSLVNTVSQASRGRVTSITIPQSLSRTYQFNVRKESEQGSRGNITWFVNPYTGVITGNSKEKTNTKEFMSTMFSLHRWLLLDKIEKPIIKGKTNRELGSLITGWATILFTLGCLTGLIIWFPQKLKTWRQGLKIKFSANWKRVNHDLHNTLGFYSVFFLLVMGLTGPFFSFNWYRTGVQKTLGTYKPKEPVKESGKKDTLKLEPVQLLSLTAYINAADKVLSYEGDYTITLPSENSPVVGISKYRTGFFAPVAADRLTLEASTAAIKKKDIFRDKPFNERVAGSIKAIHVGNVYGTFTKIIYFLACLVATSLPVTGTIIWWNKLKKKRRRKPARELLSGEQAIASI